MSKIKLTNKNTGGVGFNGVTIETTVNNLIKAIGYPQLNDNRGKDKSNFEWRCEMDDKVFCIYDWGEYKVLDYNEMVKFHIGSHGTDKDDILFVSELKKVIESFNSNKRLNEFNELKERVIEDIKGEFNRLEVESIGFNNEEIVIETDIDTIIFKGIFIENDIVKVKVWSDFTDSESEQNINKLDFEFLIKILETLETM